MILFMKHYFDMLPFLYCFIVSAQFVLKTAKNLKTGSRFNTLWREMTWNMFSCMKGFHCEDVSRFYVTLLLFVNHSDEQTDTITKHFFKF